MTKWDWPEEKPQRQQQDPRVAEALQQVAALRREMQEMRARASASAGDTKYNLETMGSAKAWQDSFWDNVDGASPITRELYMPEDIRSVEKAILRVRLKPFRSFNKATDVFEFGVVETSTLSGGVWWSVGEYDPASWTSPEPSHSHNGGTWPGGTDGHTHDVDIDNGGAHDHILPMHMHDIVMPNHFHNQVPGIFLGDSPTNVTVKLDGATVAGPFSTNQDGIDLRTGLWDGTGWKIGWPLLEISSTTVGRIECTLYMEYYVGRKVM